MALMTKLLEKALQRAAQLPNAEQDRIARLVLDEIEDEERWDATFAGSQAKLADLAAATREDIARGKMRDEDPSNRE
jgi:hypothetical protein